MSSEIHLVPVDKSNWVKCYRLELHPEQVGNLATNLETIAQSAFEEHFILRCIMKGEKVVGMLAWCPEVDEPIEGLFWLFRLMIEKSEQGKGYGRRAVELAIDEMKARGATAIRISCKPHNLVAKSCYLSIGFKEIGVLDDDDLLFELS